MSTGAGRGAARILREGIRRGGPGDGCGRQEPYTLFNPTSDRLLRDLTTDRLDMTESPFTVDARVPIPKAR